MSCERSEHYMIEERSGAVIDSGHALPSRYSRAI